MCRSTHLANEKNFKERKSRSNMFLLNYHFWCRRNDLAFDFTFAVFVTLKKRSWEIKHTFKKFETNFSSFEPVGCLSEKFRSH